MSEKTTKVKLQDIPEAGSQEWTVYSFKLLAAKYLRNDGFKLYHPIIREKEHGHIYHTHNGKTGTPNDKCAPVGGHFHECHYDQKTGDFTVGPPMRIVKKHIRGTMKVVSRVEPVKYKRVIGEGPNAGEVEDIVDTHTHEVEPIQKRVISQQMISKFQSETKGAIASYQDRTAPVKNTQAESLKKLKDSAGDAKGVMDV